MLLPCLVLLLLPLGLVLLSSAFLSGMNCTIVVQPSEHGYAHSSIVPIPDGQVKWLRIRLGLFQPTQTARVSPLSVTARARTKPAQHKIKTKPLRLTYDSLVTTTYPTQTIFFASASASASLYDNRTDMAKRPTPEGVERLAR